MPAAPTVLYPLTLPSLLNHVLNTQSSTLFTTLVVCSSREAFLLDLARPLQEQQQQGGASEGEDLRHLITPTLHNLFTAKHVQVAFCPSVQALLAHLTAYDRAAIRPATTSERGHRQRLFLVNPLALHAPTPSFSAQGLSRTFALAAETALRVDAELVLVECQGLGREDAAGAGGDSEDGGNYAEAAAEGQWEQEVSILNVSARRFGAGGGERAWAGRTIKVRRIAGRWFRFRELESSQGGG
ncbi:hypothetical protein BS50DRAFT_147356 [Corynespora cassiicola Philippines]|uniref:Elongator complex protein 5 n=1 Tax=Corynespora cassiicola Philippines TaxID=1448308 RepID=A0A2T2N8W3_CORCC|nr:hypothetical protein BS50DRAFT_147356 [Corynespora cassiicola Philippines]